MRQAAEAAGLTENAARKVLKRARDAGILGPGAKVNWDAETRLGTMPDGELAALLGVDRSAVGPVLVAPPEPPAVATRSSTRPRSPNGS